MECSAASVIMYSREDCIEECKESKTSQQQELLSMLDMTCPLKETKGLVSTVVGAHQDCALPAVQPCTFR